MPKNIFDVIKSRDEAALANFVRENPDSCREKDEYDWHPLHELCRYKPSLKSVTLVHDAYAQAIKCQDKWGWTPLHYACAKGASLEVIDFLVSKYPEALKIKTNFGELPLHYACANKAPLPVVELLVRFYPQAINEKRDDGKTPIDLAKERNAPKDVIEFLENPKMEETNDSEPSAFLSHLLQAPRNISTAASLGVFVDRLLPKVANVHELKLFCSLIMTVSRQGKSLEHQDRQHYIQEALKAATSFCRDGKSIAIYKTLLEYYKDQGILDSLTMFELDNAAEVNRMEYADFIVDMRKAIQQNTHSIQGLEGSVENLQKNMEILDRNIQMVQEELRGFKKVMRRKLQIQSSIGTICAVLNAATFGIGGNLVQAVDSIFNSIVDFGNTGHVLAIVQGKSGESSNEAMELFQQGMELANEHLQNIGEAYANSRLEKELQKEQPPLLVLGVVCAMNDTSAAVFTTASATDPQKEQQPTQTPVGQPQGGGMLSRVQVLENTYGLVADNKGGLLQRVALLESTIGVSGEGMNLRDRIAQLENL